MEAIHEVDGSIECHSSTSGEDALRELERETVALPDLIFLDLNMPKLNGKQVLKEIKRSHALQHVPVIMYSTSFAPHDIQEVTYLGAAFHLLKPSRFDDLCKSLRVILSKDWGRGGQKIN